MYVVIIHTIQYGSDPPVPCVYLCQWATVGIAEMGSEDTRLLVCLEGSQNGRQCLVLVVDAFSFRCACVFMYECVCMCVCMCRYVHVHIILCVCV